MTRGLSGSDQARGCPRTSARGSATLGVGGKVTPLVVETTNINPQQTLRGVPPSEHMRVTERFTRVDEETILYEFTVEDPTMYTQPWGGEIPIRKFDDVLYEYACHGGQLQLRRSSERRALSGTQGSAGIE